MSLRPYHRLLVAGIREQSTYRLAAFGGLIANVTFGFLKVAILFATVREAQGDLGGYDLGSMSAYIWLSQGLLGSVNFSGRSDLATRIKDGSIAIDFLRPLDVQAAAIVHEVGRSLWALVPRGVPSVLIGSIFVGMSMPSGPWPYLIGAVSLLTGITISAAVVYLVATAGFWMVETRGVQMLYMVVSGFLAGLFVPISLFPAALLAIAQATPFPAMMMYPIDILSGRVTGPAALGLLAAQLGWLAVVWTAGHLLTRAGRHRLEVQGG